MEKYTDEQGRTGVWRTVRGRRVFIRDGEDLGEAMERSGKFKTKFSPEEVDELRKAGKKGNPEGRKAKAREIDEKNEKIKRGKEIYDKLHQLSGKEQADYIKNNQEEMDEMQYYIRDKALQDLHKEIPGDYFIQKLEENENDNEYDVSELEQGKPYTVDMGNGIEKTAIFMGKDEDGNNSFYDGEGVSGTFAFSDKFMKEKIKLSDNKDDDKFMQLYNEINEKQNDADYYLNKPSIDDEYEAWEAQEKEKEEIGKEQYAEKYSEYKDAIEQYGEKSPEAKELSKELDKIEKEYKLTQKQTLEAMNERVLADVEKELAKYSNKEEKEDDISPMSEWSDTVGDGYSDAQRKEMTNYEVYEEGMKLAENASSFEERQKVNKLLDRIDRANRRGEGYSDKATNELRELLRENAEKVNSIDNYAKELAQTYNEDEEYDDKTTPKYIQDIDAGRYGNMSDKEAIKNWIDGGADIVYGDDAKQKLKEWGIPVRDDDPYATYKEELADKLLPIYQSDKEKQRVSQYFKDQEQRALDQKDYSYGFSKETLSKVDEDFLQEAYKKNQELVNKYTEAYNKDLTYDQRVKRNKQDTIWDNGMKTKYEQQLKDIQEEMNSRNNQPKYRWQDDDGNTITPSKKFKKLAGGNYVKQNEDGSSIHIASARKGDGSIEYTRYDYDKNGNDVGESKKFTSLDEAKNGSTKERPIPREKAQDFVKAYKTALEEEQNGYTQTVDWDGGTYQYSKDRLDRMAESGIKPLEHSYTGGGWQGTKYDRNLTTKEIAKTVQDDLKKNYPGVKVSRKTDYNSIDINIMSSEKDIYASSSDIDRMSDSQVSDTIRDSVGGYTKMDDWLEKNNRKGANGTFTANDERDYLKQELETYRNRKGYRVSGNEWYLSDYGKDVIGSLNKNLNSYNYDDSDGMVDYFDTNFYGGVQIGKWDKPYVVEDKKIEAKVDRYKKRKNKKGQSFGWKDRVENWTYDSNFFENRPEYKI